MDQPPPEPSIVTPAYNEERRLPEPLRRVREYLSTRPASAEVIVVDDGSSDRSAAVVEEWRSKFAGLRLLSNGRNRGKGYSVRHGMLEARGRIVLVTDADLSAPIEEADKLLAALGGHEGAIGSRGRGPSLIEGHQSPLPRLSGQGFHCVVPAG